MVLPASERPSNLRTILLAYPNRFKRTRKYVPPKYIPGKYVSNVNPAAIEGEPPDNWRINTLALSPYFKVTPKYTFVPQEGCGSGVSPGTLAGGGTSRSNDLSKPTLRYLNQARVAYQHLGPRVLKNLDKLTEQSWNTVHNFYRKQLEEKKNRREERQRKLLLEQTKGSKSPAQLKAERDKKTAEWIAVKALPRKIFLPEPISRGDVVNLEELRLRIALLSEPSKVTSKYIRPSLDPTYIDPLSVKPNAKKYIASERVLELSKNPAFKLVKLPVIIPGAVKRSALKGPVPPRFDELAVPKKKAAEKDTDLKENPFEISPFALKAKATPRTLELAKPIER